MHSGVKQGLQIKLLGIAVLAAVLSLLLFGSQTWDWYEARKMGQSQPCLNLDLRPLPNETVDSNSSSPETWFGYAFDAPWPSAEAKTIRHQAIITSANGQGLIFWDPADRSQSLNSYDFVKGVLHTTPAQISPMLSRREASRRLTLLRAKSVLCEGDHPAFYSSQQNNLACLQIGEPGLSRVVELKCYDFTGRELNFHFSATMGSASTLTQAQINRVIQTLRKTDESR